LHFPTVTAASFMVLRCFTLILTFIPCLHPILCSQFPFKVTYSLVSKKSEERLWKMESKILNFYGEWSWFCERKLFLEILSKRVSLVDFFACV
jgi:hypothetical protein